VFEHSSRHFQLREYTDASGLLSYGRAEQDFYSLTTSYMIRILRGARPADLPVEQPSRFRFVINVKTASEIDVTIPPSLLQRADQVID
jgi:putative ABC transport system substrate-binding protein